MKILALLFAIWPFHHKKPAAVPDSAGIRIGSPECYKSGYCTIVDLTKDDCTLEGDLYFYVAEDGTISFSHAGCDAAKANVEAARTFNQFGHHKI